MIASRFCAIVALSDANEPWASGPRCCSMAIWASATGRRSPGSGATTPDMPHIASQGTSRPRRGWSNLCWTAMRVLVMTPYPYGTVAGPRSSFELWERTPLAGAGITFEYAVFETDRLHEILNEPGRPAEKAL